MRNGLNVFLMILKNYNFKVVLKQNLGIRNSYMACNKHVVLRNKCYLGGFYFYI